MKVKFYGIFLFLSFLSSITYAQKTQITGTVLNSNNQQPVEFATVMLEDKTSGEALTGVTTGLDGTFSIEAKKRDVNVEISFIGFVTKTIDDIQISGKRVDLGTILLSEDVETLDEVVVRGEKSTTEFKLDKRVFNVGKDLSSTGASALDVLNNVPSVNVNIEGEISLRGSSGVQILINGKPSIIASEQGNAMGTITADMIEKIEVITNPSAKYDAEGTSGIINIVLKKEEREGLNGSATINTGIPHNHSFGLSLNRRTEKFNLFSQFGVGYRELPRDEENINRDLINNTELRSTGREFRNEQFYNIILGTDYHINKYNVMTLSGNFAYEIEDQPSNNDFEFIDANGNLESSWNRSEVTEATNPKYQYEFQYKRDFKDNKEHTLLFSALGNFFGKELTSEFTEELIAGNRNLNDQRTASDFQEGKYTFKLDYTKPFSKQWSIETGAQYVLNNVSNEFEVSDLIGGEWVANEDFNNTFEYDQNVLAFYGTGAYENNKWGVKVGLRAENTDLSTFLVNTNERNNQNFTNLFPSFHTSYKLTEAISFQAGYSRRIFRPRLWDLNPFFNIRNNFNIRVGNPDLLPEYTDSYEISGIYIAGKLSLNASIYYRYTQDVVERISTFEDNRNIRKPFNIGTNKSTGLEINGKYTATKWLTFNGDFNYNYFNREGQLEATTFDFDADQWSTKITAQLELPLDIDFEITGRYQSREQTVQSIISDQLFADLGLRKKILKGKGVLNFSIRDIFASRIRESETIQPNFELYGYGLRGRFITLGFSYGFGKGEAMEYSGKRRR